MLIVRTRLDKSDIHGIGLFAAEQIPKGTVIWMFEPDIDRSFSEDEYLDFTDIQARFIDTYGWKHKGKYFLSVELVPVFAAAVAFVMFAAATVHVIAWKNSPKQPLTILAATLLALTFAYGVQKTEAPATEIQSIVADSVAADTVAVDTVTVDTLTR